MTQEDKQLLLKDLNARLPYGVYVEHTTTKIRGKLKGIVFEHIYNDTDSIQDINAWAMFFGDEYVDATYFRPFLRPMSSMTEEECDMVEEILGDKCIFDFMSNGDIVLKQGQFSQNKLAKLYDYYNSIYVDYRGLIEKGLAIKVTEENNPYE